jgi:hypothetical protein
VFPMEHQENYGAMPPAINSINCLFPTQECVEFRSLYFGIARFQDEGSKSTASRLVGVRTYYLPAALVPRYYLPDIIRHQNSLVRWTNYGCAVERPGLQWRSEPDDPVKQYH